MSPDEKKAIETALDLATDLQLAAVVSKIGGAARDHYAALLAALVTARDAPRSKPQHRESAWPAKGGK